MKGVGFGVVDGGPAVVAVAGGEVLDLGSGHERKDRIGKEIEEANAKNTGRNAGGTLQKQNRDLSVPV